MLELAASTRERHKSIAAAVILVTIVLIICSLFFISDQLSLSLYICGSLYHVLFRKLSSLPTIPVFNKWGVCEAIVCYEDIFDVGMPYLFSSRGCTGN